MKGVNKNSINKSDGATTMKNFHLRSSPIYCIHPHDVLCGRGRGASKHIGNIRWRELISDKRKEYASLPNTHKAYLSQSIVYAVKTLNPPGRFLQKDPMTRSTWYKIGDQRAQEKTSQALREAAASFRKEMTYTERSSNLDQDYNNHQPQKIQKKRNRASERKISSNAVIAATPSPPSQTTSSNHYSTFAGDKSISTCITKRRRITISLSTKNAGIVSKETNPYKPQSSSWQNETTSTTFMLPEYTEERAKISFADHKCQNQLPVALQDLHLKDFGCRSLNIDEVFVVRPDHSHSHRDNTHSYRHDWDSLFFKELNEYVAEISWSNEDDHSRCDEDCDSSISSLMGVFNDNYDTTTTLDGVSFPQLLV